MLSLKSVTPELTYHLEEGSCLGWTLRLDPQSLSPHYVCRPLSHSGPKATTAADPSTWYLLNMPPSLNASVFSTLCYAPSWAIPPPLVYLANSYFPCHSQAEEWAPFPHGEMVKRGAHQESDWNSPGEPAGAWAKVVMVEIKQSTENHGSIRKGRLVWWETASTKGSSVFPPELFIQHRVDISTLICLKQFAFSGGKHWLPAPGSALGGAMHSKPLPPQPAKQSGLQPTDSFKLSPWEA